MATVHITGDIVRSAATADPMVVHDKAFADQVMRMVVRRRCGEGRADGCHPAQGEQRGADDLLHGVFVFVDEMSLSMNHAGSTKPK
ncbi:hypothetical protein WM40_03590 [Robbsia andropogonis]|uniref:Uncharacterized protein n=1 Tax=Robbsia andropogonis TaxID=28092 RepID=A0A0F5K5A7_9BURK|nr:hypothetical protein WM40_03590 [Robbsia andropogonis]